MSTPGAASGILQELFRALKDAAALGLRGDLYGFDVTAIDPRNSGDGSDGIVSPKFTAVLGPWADTEFYVNWGHGFHSNDARGATLTVDPRTGERVDTLTPLVTARGAEVGVRTVRIRGLQSTVALWYLGFDSELLFIGDSGVTEANRPSRRWGVEWANYMRFNPWMTGPRPLVEGGSVRSEPTTLWNGEIGITLTRQLRLSVEGFNLFNSEVADIDYFYASRLPGEPLLGVDDIHTHPSIPRTARVSLQVTF